MAVPIAAGKVAVVLCHLAPGACTHCQSFLYHVKVFMYALPAVQNRLDSFQPRNHVGFLFLNVFWWSVSTVYSPLKRYVLVEFACWCLRWLGWFLGFTGRQELEVLNRYSMLTVLCAILRRPTVKCQPALN